jgi:hypothetical protein
MTIFSGYDFLNFNYKKKTIKIIIINLLMNIFQIIFLSILKLKNLFLKIIICI